MANGDIRRRYTRRTASQTTVGTGAFAHITNTALHQGHMGVDVVIHIEGSARGVGVEHAEFEHCGWSLLLGFGDVVCCPWIPACAGIQGRGLELTLKFIATVI